MNAPEPKVIADADSCVDAVIERVGKRIVLALPLALGKPGHFVNALYRGAKVDPALQLRIATALSLNRPKAGSDPERRFLGPFLDRVFGDYPDLDNVSALRTGDLPPNVEVTEFFLNAGQHLNNPVQQQNYISSNYTHIARDMMALGVNVCAQLVSKSEEAHGTAYSLSSNPDLKLDIVKAATFALLMTLSGCRINCALKPPVLPPRAATAFSRYVLSACTYDAAAR